MKWKLSNYSNFNLSVRPCLPPPLTPLFLLMLAFCRFGGGGLSCIFPRAKSSGGAKGCCPLLAGIVGADHPDAEGIGPHTKFTNVYKNPSVRLDGTKNIGGRKLFREMAYFQCKIISIFNILHAQKESLSKYFINLIQSEHSNY
jgi:hypothetical protein